MSNFKYKSVHAPRRKRYNSAPRRNRKSTINPALFVKEAKSARQTEYVAENTFSQFAMNDLLKLNVAFMGFETPMPIQDKSIPHGLAGRDVVGVANTGTGKTIAFALPVIDKLISNSGSKALIMAPTRELAEQIIDEFLKLSKDSRINSALLIGGKPMYKQERALARKPRIVIGTPGRIKDHIKRGNLNLGQFDLAVLDEVDRMLDMGFINDIRSILDRTSTIKQSFFFSATVDHKVKSIINDFSKDPIYVEVKSSDSSDNVVQDIVSYSDRRDKMDKLHDLLNDSNVEKTLVFEETKRNVDRLHKELQERGFSVELMHGGKSQGQRKRALQRFKDSNVNVLIATDVAARGIDVEGITHVVNYSTPNSYDDYIHRIGRAGRAGRTGNALTFVEK